MKFRLNAGFSVLLKEERVIVNFVGPTYRRYPVDGDNNL